MLSGRQLVLQSGVAWGVEWALVLAAEVWVAWACSLHPKNSLHPRSSRACRARRAYQGHTGLAQGQVERASSALATRGAACHCCHHEEEALEQGLEPRGAVAQTAASLVVPQVHALGLARWVVAPPQEVGSRRPRSNQAEVGGWEKELAAE